MSIPIVSVAQMREWEKASWAAGRREEEVIRAVGAEVGRLAQELTKVGEEVLILAGKGHNGDDARAAVEHLGGRVVQVLNVQDPGADLLQLQQLLGRRPALVIDGLFGIGVNRPLSAEWVKFIAAINGAGLTVLSVDIPSGLDADRGVHYGAAVKASVTVTVGAPKAGFLASAAAPYVGRVQVTGDVGLVSCPISSDLQWTLADDFDGFPPARESTSHKGSYGHLGIVAGSPGYHGASVLAARAAQRAQPGLITLYSVDRIYLAVAAQLQAVMVSPWGGESRLPRDYDAVLIGPGLAADEVRDSMMGLMRNLWHELAEPLIIDASALDWIPLDSPAKNAVRVLTPHPGEAGRMLRRTAQQVQSDRVGTLRMVSRRNGDAWVVLKGHQTLVGRSSGPVYINSTGNPYLAQGGSGDVLGGFIAGLLAQPLLREDVGKALRYAVWQHGAAADRLQSTGRAWVVEDLIPELGQRA